MRTGWQRIPGLFGMALALALAVLPLAGCPQPTSGVSGTGANDPGVGMNGSNPVSGALPPTDGTVFPNYGQLQAQLAGKPTVLDAQITPDGTGLNVAAFNLITSGPYYQVLWYLDPGAQDPSQPGFSGVGWHYAGNLTPSAAGTAVTSFRPDGGATIPANWGLALTIETVTSLPSPAGIVWAWKQGLGSTAGAWQTIESIQPQGTATVNTATGSIGYTLNAQLPGPILGNFYYLIWFIDANGNKYDNGYLGASGSVPTSYSYTQSQLKQGLTSIFSGDQVLVSVEQNPNTQAPLSKPFIGGRLTTPGQRQAYYIEDATLSFPFQSEPTGNIMMPTMGQGDSATMSINNLPQLPSAFSVPENSGYSLSYEPSYVLWAYNGSPTSAAPVKIGSVAPSASGVVPSTTMVNPAITPQSNILLTMEATDSVVAPSWMPILLHGGMLMSNFSYVDDLALGPVQNVPPQGVISVSTNDSASTKWVNYTITATNLPPNNAYYDVWMAPPGTPFPTGSNMGATSADWANVGYLSPVAPANPLTGGLTMFLPPNLIGPTVYTFTSFGYYSVTNLGPDAEVLVTAEPFRTMPQPTGYVVLEGTLPAS